MLGSLSGVRHKVCAVSLVMGFAVLASLPAAGQESHSGDAAISPARQAMDRLAMIDGEWRGTATYWRGGEALEVVHTERVGTMLDGSVRVIEGRSYLPDGSSPFNAFAVVSFDAQSGGYMMRSYTLHGAGDVEMDVSENGFSWSIGEGARAVEYVATIDGDHWIETGYRKGSDGEKVKFIEMDLRRVGETDWPAGDPVSPE